MRLYEMLERVSEVVYQDNPSPLLTYLKNTLDDDGCFLRSRYGRRHEGEVADRELGEVGFYHGSKQHALLSKACAV